MKKLIQLTMVTAALLCMITSCNLTNKPQDNEQNPPSGDNRVHAYSDWTVTKAATCGEEGVLTRTCADCGKVEENKILPTGVHKQSEDSAVAPTCTSVGLSSGIHCSECGMVIVAQQEIPMIDHIYSSDNDASCNKCGYTRDVVCAHETLIDIPAVAPSCTESGLTAGTKCANCLDFITVPEFVPSIGHTEVVTDALAPTCTEPGYTSSTTCSVCKDVLIYKTDIPAIGHRATEWIIEKDPTEREEGLKYKVCTVCGERFADTVIPFVSANGIAYEPNAIGNTCTVTGIGTFSGKELIIPDYISGYRVTAIADYAFQNCINLTKLVLPETVKTIGTYAFSGCTELTEFTIPASVTYIGDSIFYGNENMTTLYYNATVSKYDIIRSSAITKVVFNGINVPEKACYNCTNIKEITFGSNVTEIKEWAFYYCRGLTKIEISEGVISIGDRAFYYSDNLTEVILPSSLKTIGQSAFCHTAIESITIPYGVTEIGQSSFSSCHNLKTVSLPDTVTTIGEYAFDGCNSLKSIIIPKGITKISSGMFTNSGLTSIVIPGNVKTIDRYAFENCPLVNVIIEEGVTTINYEAFDQCAQLTGVILPSTIENIESGAFNCVSLTDVYYSGTELQWSNIKIASGNEYLINAEKYYNYVIK